MKENQDSTENKKMELSRRNILAVLAAGGLSAVGLGSSTKPDDGAFDLGGNSQQSLAENYTHGAWCFSPSQLPPEEADRVAWIRAGGEAASIELADSVTLPTTWTASGLEWSIASTLAEAENNISQYPAVAFSDDGAAALLYQGPEATSWDGAGVEHVVDSSLQKAEQRRSGETPAVLWTTSGAGEVVLNG